MADERRREFRAREDKADRRESARVGGGINIKTITGEGELAISSAADVSVTGLFVEYVLPYPEGTELRVDFELPGMGHISALAKVVSASNYLPSTDLSARLGNGLRFTDIGQIEQHRIRRFVEDMLEQGA